MIINRRLQIIRKNKTYELPAGFEVDSRPVTQAFASAKNKCANAIRKSAKFASAVRQTLPLLDNYRVIFGSEFYDRGYKTVKGKTERYWLCRHCGGLVPDFDVARHGRVESAYRRRRKAGLT